MSDRPAPADRTAAGHATSPCRPLHQCSLAQTLEFVGERWTFLVLREALAGTTRFAEFRAALGIAPDVLSARLGTLVAAGIMMRVPYKEPGQRAREAYHLTDAGRQFSLVLGALQQWGDAHVTDAAGPTMSYRTPDGRPVAVRFVDDQGRVLAQAEVRLERTAALGGPDARAERTL
jgi:DNA-binding HxlR family transcriptional regulator